MRLQMIQHIVLIAANLHNIKTLTCVRSGRTGIGALDVEGSSVAALRSTGEPYTFRSSSGS